MPVAELRDITVATEGNDIVATNLVDILEPLRAKNVLVKAGAKFLTNLTGDVQVPVMGAGNVTWEGETASAKDAGNTFTSVKLSPKRLTAYVDISKQMLVQDSVDVENMLRNDLVNAISSKLEATVLGNAVGSATQPAGIFNGKTPTNITDFASVADLEASVEDANVLGECTYIMSNKAKAQFRALSITDAVNAWIGGTVDGTSAYNTSNVSGTNYVYGDFSNLAIGQWGSIDLTVDPYTLAAEGKVRLVVNAYFDAKVLRDNAFAFGTFA
jgi:HK97 family phage major capsid protein